MRSIAAFGGDTVAAARLFADRYHGETNITVLVDFENDSVRTALEVADALGERLWGVRLDTASSSSTSRCGRADPDSNRGVTALLTRRVRDALDAAGHRQVRIVVSGGFDAEKIARSRPRARRSTPTASAPRCCAGRTTSRPTWFASTAARWPRPAGGRTRIPGWSSSS